MKKLFLGLWLAAMATPIFADHELDFGEIENGKRIYGDQCASCHGINLEEEPNWQQRKADGTLPAPPHDESGHTWHHDNQLLFLYTKLGGQKLMEQRGIANFKSGMPKFDGVISDQEIIDVLAYIRSTWPEEIQSAQNSRNPKH